MRVPASDEVAHLVDGELINQDITWPGDDRTNHPDSLATACHSGGR